MKAQQQRDAALGPNREGKEKRAKPALPTATKTLRPVAGPTSALHGEQPHKLHLSQNACNMRIKGTFQFSKAFI